jgi:hypothetical protein
MFGESQISGLWKTRGSKQRLGVWVSSEEELKPKRGSRKSIIGFSGPGE